MTFDPKKLFDLNGKVAAITGGGGELCGKMSEALAVLGVKVAILDINSEKAKQREKAILENGGSAKAFKCDVLDEAELKKRSQQITKLWEEPDILINGAGGNDPCGSTNKEFLEYKDLDDPDIKGFFDFF